MEIEKVIEKLLNRDSILNLLENDIIKKFEVSVSPYESKILVIKIFLNITKDELVGTEKLSSTELLSDVFASVKYGMKSRYYINSKTSKEIGLNASETLDAELCVGCTI